MCQKYKKLPEFLFHQKLQLSPEQTLSSLWKSIETNIIHYLQEQLTKYRSLFTGDAELMPIETEHVSRFLKSLEVMQEKIKTLREITLPALDNKKAKLDFIVKENAQIQLMLQWFDSVLKNLALTGNDDRYLIPYEDLSSYKPTDPLPSQEEIPSDVLLARITILTRLNMVYETNEYHFTNFRKLFEDCRNNIAKYIKALNQQCSKLELFSDVN